VAEEEQGGDGGLFQRPEEGVEPFPEPGGGNGEPGEGGVEDDKGIMAAGHHPAEFVQGFGEGQEGQLLVVGDDAELLVLDGVRDVGAQSVGLQGDVVGGFFGEKEDLFADPEHVREEAERQRAGAAPALARKQGGTAQVQPLEEVVEGRNAGFDLLERHGAVCAGKAGRGGTAPRTGRGLRKGSALRVRGCGPPGR
jgi:hypothetical protein